MDNFTPRNTRGSGIIKDVVEPNDPSAANKKEIAKVLIDKLNHLKADLSQHQNKKLDKVIAQDKIIALKAQIELIGWLQKKLYNTS